MSNSTANFRHVTKDKPKPKRKSFTIDQKANFIKEIEQGAQHEALAAKYGIPRSTISNIWKKRERIKASFRNCDPKMKKSRAPMHSNLDEALFQWVRDQRTIGIPLDGTIIKAKAMFFADALGISNFTGSNGWFEGWKRRHDIRFQKLSGESGSAPVSSKESWLEDKWPVIRAGYQSSDIFNADETGLFFKLLPEKSYNTKFDKSNGKKKSKERVTVLACCNMSGTEKLPLLVIGKSARPRGFPKVLSGLPVTYRNNKKAWMTGELWEEWIRNWDARLHKEKRKILLLIDNCTAHVKIPFLKNIEVENFPANVTSILQPMDQGIIKNLKTFYRRFVIERLLAHLGHKNELLNLRLIDAVFLIDSAWKPVKPSTMTNCFRHAGISSEEYEVELLEDSFAQQNQGIFVELFEKLGCEMEDNETAEKYFTIDDEELVCVVRSDQEIINSVSQPEQIEEETVSDDEPEVMESQEQRIAPNVFDCIDDIRTWLMNCSIGEEAHSFLNGLERTIFQQKMERRKQSLITDFF